VPAAATAGELPYFVVELEPLEPELVVPEPELDGDVAELLPGDGDGEVDPLPVRSEVDGDADGALVPRSLELPDGPWLQPVASAAMSEKAKTPVSNFFMKRPSWWFCAHRVAQQSKCRRRGCA
jgi:hypothetical protein